MGTVVDKGTVAGVALGDGILIINKPMGWTSHDVVAKLRGLLGESRMGHGGTLDPAATGVLPILIGKATRIAEYLLDWDKEYRALLRLGETTDTQDATGTVVRRSPTEGLTEEAIRAAVGRFQGRVAQLPPMYSAVKVGGVPLYKAARAGRTVERGHRLVTVHHIEVTSLAGTDVELQVVCSKGTYIRTLCADIGETLGVGGHLRTLERLRVGPLRIEQALSIEEIRAKLRREQPGQLSEHLLPLDEALKAFPAVVVMEVAEKRVKHGAPVSLGDLLRQSETDPAEWSIGQLVRVKNATGRFLALGKISEPRVAGRKDLSREGNRQVAILKVFVDGQMES